MGRIEGLTAGCQGWIGLGACILLSFAGDLPSERRVMAVEPESPTCFTFLGTPYSPPPASRPDEDGIPDLWEQQIIDDNPADAIDDAWDVRPGDDYDGDGFANRDEYLAGTDPTRTNVQDRTIILAIHRPAGH